MVKVLWGKATSALVAFVKDNKLLLVCLAFYLCFENVWENLYEVHLVPFFANFSVSYATSAIFGLASIWLLVGFVKKYRKGMLVSNSSLGISIFVLYLWLKYRFVTSNALPSCIPYLCYVDIVALWAAGYIVLKLLAPAQKVFVSTSIGFAVDQPIMNGKDDLLNRKQNAHDAVDKLLATKTDNSAFTFGVVAPWGLGKSSFMYMMKEYIEANYSSQVLTLSFHPWIYGKSTDLTYIFFKELSKVIAPYNSCFSQQLIRYAQTLSKVETVWTKSLAVVFSFLQTQSVEEQYNMLKHQIGCVRRKIVVFVDDVDRLDANEIEEVFRLARNTSNLPYMYFVIAYDKKYVVDTLNHRLSSHSLKYSQKILQEEYSLPIIKKEQLKKLLLDRLEGFLYHDEAYEIGKLVNGELFYQIDVFKYIGTIRDIKRIVNALHINLRNLHGEVNVCDYFIVEIFRQVYPLVFQMLVDKKDAVLFMDNSGKYVYFDGKNKPKEDDGLASKIYKREYFNILGYVRDHSSELFVPQERIEDIKCLMDALFGIYRTKKDKGIDVTGYTQRYFYASLLDADISDCEFDELYKSPFGEMKPKLKEWMVNKSLSLVQKVEQLKCKGKEDAYKQLHILFYLGAIGQKVIPETQGLINLIKNLREFTKESRSYTKEDYSQVMSCLLENGINSFQLDFLCELFRDGFFVEDFIFSESEVIELQQKLFLQYIGEEHSMMDVLLCWRDTSHEVFVSHADGYGHKEQRHTEPARLAMKNYAKRHVVDFAEATLSFYRPNTDKQYSISEVVPKIWGSWDDYYNYVVSQEIKTPKYTEYKEFLEKVKEKGFDQTVNFTFKELSVVY